MTTTPSDATEREEFSNSGFELPPIPISALQDIARDGKVGARLEQYCMECAFAGWSAAYDSKVGGEFYIFLDSIGWHHIKLVLPNEEVFICRFPTKVEAEEYLTQCRQVKPKHVKPKHR